MGGGFFGCKAEAAGQGHIFGAGAQAVLLVAAPQLGENLNPLFHIEGAHPFGGVDLVAADGHQVHVPLHRLEGDFAERLDCVAVDEGIGRFFADAFHRLCHRQDGAHLVVDCHQADQDGVFVHRFQEVFQGDDPPAVRLHINRLESLFFQLAEGGQHRRVFKGGGDDFVAPALFGLCPAEDGQVVRLSSAGGDGDAPGVAAQDSGDPLKPLFPFQLGHQPPPVEGRGVAVLVYHHICNIAGHFRVSPGGGTVV